MTIFKDMTNFYLQILRYAYPPPPGALSIESKEMNSPSCKISLHIFLKKKWKCSYLSVYMSQISVKLWRISLHVITSFLEIKSFISHSLMDCTVKECIQHAYCRLKIRHFFMILKVKIWRISKIFLQMPLRAKLYHLQG